MNFDEQNDAFNAEIRSWGTQTIHALELKLAGYGIRQRTELRQLVREIKKNNSETGKQQELPLVPSLKMRYKEQNGAIERIKLSLARHGIFLERGVGRGRKKDSGKTQPKLWINPVMSVEVPRLADILVKQNADRVGKQLRFTVPGVIDIKFEM